MQSITKRASSIIAFVVVLSILFLVFYPEIMRIAEPFMEEKFYPWVDKVSMSWLQDRGIEFSKQELEVGEDA